MSFPWFEGGRQPVEESKVAFSVKRTFAVAESLTVIVTSFTGRLAGVLEQVGGGPAAKVPIAHDQDPSTCIEYPFVAVGGWSPFVGTEAKEPWRKASIFWSASAPAVVPAFARLTARSPEL